MCVCWMVEKHLMRFTSQRRWYRNEEAEGKCTWSFSKNENKKEQKETVLM